MTRDEQTREKKRQILVAALDCFTRHGLGGTTIEMIREASGSSVGSLYHHFGNKEAIAAAVYLAGLRDFGVRARAYLAQASDAESGVKALVYANVDWISEQPDWARFVFQHRSTVAQGEAQARLGEDLRRFHQDALVWFAPQVARGAFKPLPLDLFASLIQGPTHDYARHWLSGRYSEPLQQHREILAEAAWLAVKA